MILPVLKDGDHYVPDSWDIAVYLEKKVPSPSIFPGGIAEHENFREYVKVELQVNVLKWLLPQVPAILDERGAEYFKRTREQKFGQTLEEVSKGGDEKFLPLLKDKMTRVFHALKDSEAYIFGKDFGYADCLILGLCHWINRVDSGKFLTFLELDDQGRFTAWHKRCEPYYPRLN